MRTLVITLGVTGLILGLGGSAFAQAGAKNDGKTLFRMHCATCHGLDAKGSGPTAPSLKKQPADLTILQAPGKPFPAERVQHMIDGTGESSSHGSREMPIWGEVFRYTKGTPPSQLAVNRLVDFLKTIQVNK